MGALFSPDVLAELRTLNEDNLPDSFEVTPQGEFTDDNEGGGTFEAGETETFPCRVSPLNAREQETLVDEQLREPGLELMVFAVGQVLAVTSTGEVTLVNGEVYSVEVKGVVKDPTYVMLRRAVIKRIDDPVSDDGS